MKSNTPPPTKSVAVGDFAEVQREAAAPSPILRFRSLRKSFGGQTVLDGISGEIRPGEVILLSGENGSGKTTLLNILSGCLEPEGGTIDIFCDDGFPAESFHFPHRWYHNLNPFEHFTPERVARLGISRTWQDIRLIPSLDLADNIGVASGNSDDRPWSAIFCPRQSREISLQNRATAIKGLSALGLSERDTSSADKISLGQSKRVAIARAVAADARILFLDEPLAGLDRQGIADIVALLRDLVREHRMTLVIIEHVLNHVHLHHLVTADWQLVRGKLETDSVLINSAAERESAAPQASAPHWLSLLAAPEDLILHEHLPRGAVLTRIRRKHFDSNQHLALEISNLVISRGSRLVIGTNENGESAGFSLTLHHGEIAVLQAPNGWGKSTLLGCIAGVLPAASGTVSINSEDITALPAWERVSHGLHLMTAGADYFRQLTIAEVRRLAGSPATNGSSPPIPESRILDSLSGGQLRRVSLATSLHRTANTVLLLDEPFLALDQEGMTATARLIRQSPAASLIAEPFQI